MPSLVDDLIQMASKPDVRVSDLLRKAKAAASKLGLRETAAWIDAELMGYSGQPIPEYRKMPVQLMAAVPFVQGLQAVREPTWLIEITNKPRPMPHPIREIEQMAAQTKPLFVALAPGLVEELVKLGANTREFWHMTTPAAAEGVVDAVKTHVLEWALELDRQGIRGENMRFSQEEQHRAQGITLNFHGPTNFTGVVGTSVGTGASHITQTATSYADQARALAAMLRQGATQVPDEDAPLLTQAADSLEGDAGSPGALHNTLAWIRIALPKVASWGGKAAASAALEQLVTAVARAHGLG